MTREEQIKEAAERYMKDIITPLPASIKTAFVKGAEWTDEHPDLYSVTRKAVDRALANLWHDAQGDYLPIYDREVIVLCGDGHGGYKVCFGHRPYKKGYFGKSLITGNIETYYPETYDKGGWNIPDVRWWMDCDLPKMEE